MEAKPLGLKPENLEELKEPSDGPRPESAPPADIEESIRECPWAWRAFCALPWVEIESFTESGPSTKAHGLNTIKLVFLYLEILNSKA